MDHLIPADTDCRQKSNLIGFSNSIAPVWSKTEPEPEPDLDNKHQLKKNNKLNRFWGQVNFRLTQMRTFTEIPFPKLKKKNHSVRIFRVNSNFSSCPGTDWIGKGTDSGPGTPAPPPFAPRTRGTSLCFTWLGVFFSVCCTTLSDNRLSRLSRAFHCTLFSFTYQNYYKQKKTTKRKEPKKKSLK